MTGRQFDMRLVTTWSGIRLSRNFSTGYIFRAVSKGCYYVNDDGVWVSDGLNVVDESNLQFLRCNSTHHSSFAGGLFIPPNSVNFDYVLRNASFENNISIYFTLLVILLTYVVMMLFAKYKDELDSDTLRSLALADNLMDVSNISFQHPFMIYSKCTCTRSK